MDNDDKQIGRILSRREVLALFGAAGSTLLVGCGPEESPPAAATGAPTAAAAVTTPSASVAEATVAPTPNAEAATTVAIEGNPTAETAVAVEGATAEVANTQIAGNGTAVPSCVVRPEMTEGPYYVAQELLRSDIRTDSTNGAAREGIPLVLTFRVSQISGSSCAPLEGTTVEIWHCDAAGAYSGVSDPGFSTEGENWLRGAQVTDANGLATFTTIYPGWYPGRTVHIHFMVHPDETKVFTSQLFFDDALSDQVFTQVPYASRGQRNRLNSNDSLYDDLLLLTVTQTAQGYAADFDIGIDPSTIDTRG